MIKRVSKILLKPTEKLHVKLSVGLLDSRGNEDYYSVFESGQYDYLTFSMSANVILEYKSKGPWDINQRVCITESNIFYWNQRLQSFYKKIQDPELYTYYTSGKIDYNGDDSYRTTIVLNNDQFVELEPGLIYPNNNGEPIPGIFMRLNIRENVVELPFDQFESIMYKFSQINISMEANQLVMLYLMVKERVLDAKRNQKGDGRPIEKPKVNIFQSKEALEDIAQPEEIVVDNRIIVSPTLTSLDDLQRLQ